ncbi:MAG TPA: hypothetical protein DD643_05310 [Synechococcus sp. UBA8638]|nr:hypothetical protein [Synechococcus sp. UBA8638]
MCPVPGFWIAQSTSSSFHCPTCGHQANTDLNGARNILSVGIGASHCRG